MNSSVTGFLKGMFKSKHKPKAEPEVVNPVIAKYSSMLATNSPAKGNQPNVPAAAISVEDDMDSIVDSIISEQLSTTKIYANVLVEDLFQLETRCGRIQDYAQSVLDQVDYELSKDKKTKKKGYF